MKWRSARYVGVGVVAFVIGLIAFLPARIAAGWVEATTTLSLGGVTGTLLSGHAGYAAGPGGAVANLDWTLHPAALVLGHISADLKADSDLSGFSAHVSHSLFGATVIDDLTGRATAGWLAKRAGYTFLPLSGDISIDIERASFDDALHFSALSGRIGVANVRWELFNPPVRIGRFTGALSHQDNAIRLTIANSKGGLAMTGQASLDDDHRYRVDIRLRARAGADKRLKQMLGQLGRADSEGWHRLRERGRL